MRSRPLAAAVVALLAVPAAAPAVERTVRDQQGRTIRFDVRAPGVDVRDYARVLRAAIHGDEIEDVVITIVPKGRIGRSCGTREAEACYGRRRGLGRITVPVETGAKLASLLLHEYGHHIDGSRENGDRPEPNGTPRWWAARRMGQRLAAGEVAFDYSRGWARSIGEIFAEDYVSLNVKGFHSIGWLRAPNAAVLAALRRDLTGRATGPAPRDTPPEVKPPVTVPLNGMVAAGADLTEGFGLLGTGRRIRVTLTSVSQTAEPATVRVAVTCEGVVLAEAQASDGVPAAIDVQNAGPGSCTLTVSALTPGVAAVTGELTLSVGAAPPAPG